MVFNRRLTEQVNVELESKKCAERFLGRSVLLLGKWCGGSTPD
jgi:hypothetical protein